MNYNENSVTKGVLNWIEVVIPTFGTLFIIILQILMCSEEATTK
jgi:hypothetical protein